MQLRVLTSIACFSRSVALKNICRKQYIRKQQCFNLNTYTCKNTCCTYSTYHLIPRNKGNKNYKSKQLANLNMNNMRMKRLKLARISSLHAGVAGTTRKKSYFVSFNCTQKYECYQCFGSFILPCCQRWAGKNFLKVR